MSGCGGGGVGILKLLNNTQGAILWITVTFTSAVTLFSPLDPFECVSSPGLSLFICAMGRKLFIFEHSATGFCDGVVNLFTTVNISSRIFNHYIYLLSYLRNRMYMYVGICFYLTIEKHIECFWLVKLGPISIKDRKLHSLSPSVPSPLSVLPSLSLPASLPPTLSHPGTTTIWNSTHQSPAAIVPTIAGVAYLWEFLPKSSWALLWLAWLRAQLLPKKLHSSQTRTGSQVPALTGKWN